MFQFSCMRQLKVKFNETESFQTLLSHYLFCSSMVSKIKENDILFCCL